MKKQVLQTQEISAPEYLAAIFFLAIPTLEFFSAFSTGEPYYINHLLWVHRSVMRAVALAFWSAGGCFLLLPTVRKTVEERFEKFEREPLQRYFVPGAACLSFTLLGLFLKFCQFRSFQLPLDSTAMAQMAFNTLHGHWLQIPVFGCNALAIHFAFTIVFFSPILLIWNSALPLLLIQTLALGSLGLAVHELIWLLTSSSLFAFLGMLLCYAHPHWHTMLSANLDNSLFAPALFIWAAVCWKSNRKIWATLLLALMLTTREQATFTISGLGIYWALKNRDSTQREIALGGAIVIVMAVTWLVMMKIVRFFNSPMGALYWHLYSHFGSTREEVIHFVLTHPFLVLAKIVWPPLRLWPNARAILYMALAPLAAPLELVPYLLAGLPQMLMIDSGPHDLTAPQYPALAFGPLLVAMAYGLAYMHKLENISLRKYVMVPVLIACGFGFKNSSSVLLPNWLLDWFHTAPKILEQIPPQASVWADEWTTPWLACRWQLKSMPLREDPSFSDGLFRPQYVLMQKKWITEADPPQRNRLLTFLKGEGYLKIVDRAPRGTPLSDPANLAPYAERNDLVLLKDPQLRPPGEASAALTLPQAVDEHELLAYVKYLIEP